MSAPIFDPSGRFNLAAYEDTPLHTVHQVMVNWQNAEGHDVAAYQDIQETAHLYPVEMKAYLAAKGAADPAHLALAVDEGELVEPEAGFDLPRPKDPLAEWATVEYAETPSRPRFLIEGMLPAGAATLLSGHGETGKTDVSLGAAVCMAVGKPFQGNATEQAKVLFLSFEDPAAVLQWRLRQKCAALGVDPAEVMRHLEIIDATRGGQVLWTADGRPTAQMTALAARVRDRGQRVIIVDNVSLCFAGNENARGDVQRFVSAMTRLAPADGAVLLIGHASKGFANGLGSEGYSGSTAWHNAVRCRWQFETLEKGGDRQLVVAKNNYGRKAEPVNYRWSEEFGTLVWLGGEEIRAERQACAEELDAAVLSAVGACQERGIFVPTAATGIPASLRAPAILGAMHPALVTLPPKEILDALRRLVAAGRVEHRTVKRPSRNKADGYFPTACVSSGA